MPYFCCRPMEHSYKVSVGREQLSEPVQGVLLQIQNHKLLYPSLSMWGDFLLHDIKCRLEIPINYQSENSMELYSVDWYNVIF